MRRSGGPFNLFQIVGIVVDFREIVQQHVDGFSVGVIVHRVKRRVGWVSATSFETSEKKSLQ